MKVHELIESLGEELYYQWLHEALLGMEQTKKGTRVTFATDAVSAHKEMTGTQDKVGLICWIPRKKYEQAFAQQNQQSKQNP